MIVFSAFFVITLLLALPTLVSLAQHRGPRQFGTDHIAGILVSWAAVGIFGEPIRVKVFCSLNAYLTNLPRALTNCPEISLLRGATATIIALAQSFVAAIIISARYHCIASFYSKSHCLHTRLSLLLPALNLTANCTTLFLAPSYQNSHLSHKDAFAYQRRTQLITIWLLLQIHTIARPIYNRQDNIADWRSSGRNTKW